ncbi:MAG: bifunctional precorrin-2 dehydrogenase/sirohydrochlorin ferrochelatase [Eubacteriales bacterium]|nr:bifunctional precorrin-2 dehydrogenase/sirohydrochlorin ferrochelatase [Eubacteriales bacterium]
MYFPMFIDLEGRSCLVAGGGKIAYRKLLTLRDFGAKVTAAAPAFCEEITELAAADKEVVTVETGLFDVSMAKHGDGISACSNELGKLIEGKTLVIAATGSHELNHGIAIKCRELGIPINAVDQKEDCSFIFPSYVKEGDLVAAFSSGGKSPMLTQILKDREREMLTPLMGKINDLLGCCREFVPEVAAGEEERKRIYREIYDISISRGSCMTIDEVKQHLNIFN